MEENKVVTCHSIISRREIRRNFLPVRVPSIRLEIDRIQCEKQEKKQNYVLPTDCTLYFLLPDK